LNYIKVIGGVLVFFGFLFRAISIAYFKVREDKVPDNPQARRRFEASKRRALMIDAAFIAFGFLVILQH